MDINFVTETMKKYEASGKIHLTFPSVFIRTQKDFDFVYDTAVEVIGKEVSIINVNGNLIMKEYEPRTEETEQ